MIETSLVPPLEDLILLLCSRVLCGRRDNLSVATRSFRPNLVIYSFIFLLLDTVYTLISLNETADTQDLLQEKGGRVTNDYRLLALDDCLCRPFRNLCMAVDLLPFVRHFSGHTRRERDPPSNFLFGTTVRDASKGFRVFVPTRSRKRTRHWAGDDALPSSLLVFSPKRFERFPWNMEDGCDWRDKSRSDSPQRLDALTYLPSRGAKAPQCTHCFRRHLLPPLARNPVFIVSHDARILWRSKLLGRHG